jgi:hypothetical protein
MTLGLLSAYAWYRDCPPTWKDRAFEGLKNTLRGIFEPSTGVQRLGDIFEQKLPKLQGYGDDIVGFKAGTWLYGTEITSGKTGNMYLFKGKMDFSGVVSVTTLHFPAEWLGKSVIVDAKTTGKSINLNKYEDSLQHTLYCLDQRVKHFQYRVAQITEDREIIDFQVLNLEVNDLDKARIELMQAVEELEVFLQEMNLWDMYQGVFCGGKK